MQQWLNKYGVYYPIQWFRREHVWRLLPELVRTETFSSDELDRYLKEKVRVFLNLVYKGSSYYRKVLSNVGYVPGDSMGWSEFGTIPLLTKEIVNKEGANILSVTACERAYQRSTSGSTGQPFMFPKDRQASAYMEAVMYEVYGWHNIEIGDRSGRIWGTPISTNTRIYQKIKDIMLNRRRLSVFEMEEHHLESYWKRLKDFRPKYLYSYPNALNWFASYLLDHGYDGNETGVEVIICTGELLLPQQKAIIEKAFRCRVINEYGSTENGIIAFECPDGGFHLTNQILFVECVDPQGRPVPNGQHGEIVVTEFQSRKISFLRYRIGDIGRIINDKCPCGRPFPLLDIRVGRIDSFIITPDGTKVYDAILAYVFKEDFAQFRVFQETVNLLKINYIPAHSLTEAGIHRLEKKLRSHLGNKLNIQFQKVDSIPSDPSGKLRYFTGLKQQ